MQHHNGTQSRLGQIKTQAIDEAKWTAPWVFLSGLFMSMPFGGCNWWVEMDCLKQRATPWALLVGLDAPRQRLPIIDKVPCLGLVPYAGSDSRPWYLSSSSALSLSHCSRTLYLISHVRGICRWGHFNPAAQDIRKSQFVFPLIILLQIYVCLL